MARTRDDRPVVLDYRPVDGFLAAVEEEDLRLQACLIDGLGPDELRQVCTELAAIVRAQQHMITYLMRDV